MELYDNIKKYRQQMNLTQQQFADLTGYGDRSSIAKIEKGLVDISQSKLELFAKVLHVSAGELLGNTEFDLPQTLTASEQALLLDYRSLNEEGQEKVSEYTSDLVASGRYKKDSEDGMVEEA